MPRGPDKLVLSSRMVSYLLMQRTEYRRKGHKSIKKTLKKIGLPITLDTFLLWTERFRKNQLASSYYADLAEDLKSFVDYLPKEATSCLDIGRGLGGIDVLLFRHWGPSVKLHLLDRSSIVRVGGYAVFAVGEGIGVGYPVIDILVEIPHELSGAVGGKFFLRSKEFPKFTVGP